MSWTSVIWNGNTKHVEQHGLTPDDVDAVLSDPLSFGKSRSSGEPAVFGYTLDDRYIIVVYMEIDAHTIYPITAYSVREPGR